MRFACSVDTTNHILLNLEKPVLEKPVPEKPAPEKPAPGETDRRSADGFLPLNLPDLRYRSSRRQARLLARPSDDPLLKSSDGTGWLRTFL